jgi:hypothetical protein
MREALMLDAALAPSEEILICSVEIPKSMTRRAFGKLPQPRHATLVYWKPFQ